jgi:hypothetical protein
MKKETIMNLAIPAAVVATSIAVGFAGITAAESTATNPASAGTTSGQHQGMRPGVFGKVTAVSGTTLTVESTNPKDNTTTMYTVDASSASVKKVAQGSAPTNSSVSAIAVGDSVAVRGTVSGTNVTATSIMDGIMPFGHGGMGRGPGVGGTVTGVSGNTITITGKDGKIYTIDASNASLDKLSTINVSDVQVGDQVGAEGTLSGTTLTAKHVLDGMPALGERSNQ